MYEPELSKWFGESEPTKNQREFLQHDLERRKQRGVDKIK
jgi:hypothetical protein